MRLGRRQRIVVTGASGYIGARLVELALARGCDVVRLGATMPHCSAPGVAWRLGEAPPAEVLAGADAVIHLAHSWAADAATGEADNLNMAGTLALAQATCQAGVARFIYASTTSARAEALNVYGRIKFTIEHRLSSEMPPNAIGIARIGLVYGGPEQGLYGLSSRIVDLAGVLPMIGLDRRVQPIHLDEVCAGLLALALAPVDGRVTFVLAGPEPLTFAAWLKMLRRARTGRGLVFIPIPIKLALLACDATALIPFGPTVSRERVLGLAGAAPMDSITDLAAMGIVPRDPVLALAVTATARRRLLRDARTMLDYVAGRRVRETGPIRRLAKALAADPASRTALPRIAWWMPGLLRLFEPLRPSAGHGLSRRLHLAAMVMESSATALSSPSLLKAAVHILLDVATAPVRILLQRYCA
jgi:nucleoside-diphosphate-sugar epimerase